MDHLGERVVAALGPAAAAQLLEVLDRPDAGRAALIGRLHVRDDAAWLAEMLIDLEDEVGEMLGTARGCSASALWVTLR